jgi:hypothetical protein
MPSVVTSGATRVRASLAQTFRMSTARVGLRLLPDFIIIGTQRGGTTSLFKLLSEHPGVGMPYRKEVHYFDNQYDQPLTWYQSYFPTTIRRRMQERYTGNFVTGEASPYYMFHPHAPERVHQTLPDVKVIAMLRNPVDRALSHYQHSVMHGLELASFSAALDREPERLANEERKLLADPEYYSFSHQNHSYAARGVYVDQLRRWEASVPQARTLVIQSERFYQDPNSVLHDVCRFLEIDEFSVSIPKKHNAIAYDAMEPATKRRLAEYFRPHNQRLFEHLGVEYDWDA